MENVEKVVGGVKMRVRRGINLVARDAQTSDPYVKVTMGSQNDNCNPEWNDELSLAITDPPDLPLKLTVYDDDTFTADDEMGWAEVDVESIMQCARMELESVRSGTVVSRIHPNRENCLAEESKILWKDGKLLQDMTLRLKDVETGEVEIQLEWVDV